MSQQHNWETAVSAYGSSLALLKDVSGTGDLQAEVQLSMGRALCALGRYPDARTAVEFAWQIVNVNPDTARTLAASLLDTPLESYGGGDFNNAYALADAALPFYSRTEVNASAQFACHMLAAAAASIDRLGGSPELTVVRFKGALRLASSSGIDSLQVASCHVGMATSYYKLDDYDAATEEYRNAIDIFKRVGGEGSHCVNCYCEAAMAFGWLGNEDEMLRMLENARMSAIVSGSTEEEFAFTRPDGAGT